MPVTLEFIFMGGVLVVESLLPYELFGATRVCPDEESLCAAIFIAVAVDGTNAATGIATQVGTVVLPTAPVVDAIIRVPVTLDPVVTA